MAKGLDLTTATGYILVDTTLESGITNTCYHFSNINVDTQTGDDGMVKG